MDQVKFVDDLIINAFDGFTFSIATGGGMFFDTPIFIETNYSIALDPFIVDLIKLMLMPDVKILKKRTLKYL